MSSGNAAADGIQIVQSSIRDTDELVRLHISSLSYPIDSYLEDKLLESTIYRLTRDNDCIGYAGMIRDTLQFFHVRKEHFRYAPTALERIVEEKAVRRAYVMTQDPLFCALIAEWDYAKDKHSCWFTDLKTENSRPQVSRAIFRTAADRDEQRIREISGGFLDDASGGFACLEERIAAGIIFLLEDSDELLGCGVVERGRFCRDVVSIGMYTNRNHRNKGVARTILLKLKEWAYDNGLVPVAGCWYYNTLSRRSLESAGMAATSIGYAAILNGKEKLPLRTGNPPGELVEE